MESREMESELRRAGGLHGLLPAGQLGADREPTGTSPICQQISEHRASEKRARPRGGGGCQPLLCLCLSICLSLSLWLSRTHPFRHLSHQQGLRLCAGPPSMDKAQTTATSAASLPRGLSLGLWAPCLSKPRGLAAVLRLPPP